MSGTDGGPAFTVPPGASHAGMSLREWYAGQALVGLVATPIDWTDDKDKPVTDPDQIARIAFQLADALLSERSKKT